MTVPASARARWRASRTRAGPGTCAPAGRGCAGRGSARRAGCPRRARAARPSARPCEAGATPLRRRAR
eukprot:643042-Pyramimonas_sp.AAC.1